MGAGFSAGQVVDLHNGQQVWVQRPENKLCLVPSPICDLRRQSGLVLAQSLIVALHNLLLD